MRSVIVPAVAALLVAVFAAVGAIAQEEVRTYPPGTRTGIPQVDRFLDLMEARDRAGLLGIIKYRVLPCARPWSYEAPECTPDEEPGTPVKTFYAGGWVRAEDAPEFVEWFVATERGLFGVKSGPSFMPWMAARFSLLFAVEQVPSFVWLDRLGRIAGVLTAKNSGVCEAWRAGGWSRHPRLLKPLEPCPRPAPPPLHLHWLRILGGPAVAKAAGVAAGAGGSIFVASSLLDGEDGSTVMLQRRDAEGRPLWRRLFRRLASPRAAVASGPAGGAYLVVERAGRRGDADLLVVRLDEDGEIVWRRRVGGRGREQIVAVAAAQGGGLFVLATSTSEQIAGERGHGRADILLAKLSATGEQEWVRLFGGIRRDTATSLSVAPGGSVYVLGRLRSPDVEGEEVPVRSGVVVMRYGVHGLRFWFAFPDPRLVRSELKRAIAIVAYRGGAYVTGVSGSETQPTTGVGRVVHFQPDGQNRYWNNTTGVITGVIRVQDGDDFVAVGFTRRQRLRGQMGNGAIETLLSLLDERGLDTWFSLLGGVGDDVGRGVVLSGGSVVLVATTSSPQIRGHRNRGPSGVLLAKYVPPAERAGDENEGPR